jgi:hypothetical protein
MQLTLCSVSTSLLHRVECRSGDLNLLQCVHSVFLSVWFLAFGEIMTFSSSMLSGPLTFENEGTLFFRNVGNHSHRQYHCCAKLKRRKLVVHLVAYNLSSAVPEIIPEYPVSWPSGWCLAS